MSKSAILSILLLAVFGALAAWAVAFLTERGTNSEAVPPAPRTRQRIVSLSPAVTETLFAIGAGPDVVGRTEWCDYPAEVAQLPVVGTSLTPSFESISRQHPTLIVGEATKDAPLSDFQRIAPTRLLAWLSLADICAGIRELGRLTGREEAAEKLAAIMDTRLRVPVPGAGPRVLLAMDGTPGQLKDVWFLRQNSIHGACLNAAGARNAVSAEFVGSSPNLSLERVIALDPDVIIVLTASTLSEAQRSQLLQDWRGLPMLRAVKADKVRVLDGREYYRNGPRIVELIDKLKAALE